MNERKGLVTMKGNPVTLIGNEIKVGDAAPEFEVVANDLSPVKFSDYKGKICIISSVPSIDTPVCDLQTRRFNVEAEKLGEDIAILTISMDLPFAQARWCGAAGVSAVKTLSDHKEAYFGNAYGLLIKELRLLARAVILIDAKGVVRYIEIVGEIATEPNYAAVLDALEKLTKEQ